MLQAMVCVAVCLIDDRALLRPFQWPTTPPRTSPLEYAGNLAAVAYRGIFYAYLVYCLIGIARPLPPQCRHRCIHGPVGF